MTNESATMVRPARSRTATSSAFLSSAASRTSATRSSSGRMSFLRRFGDAVAVGRGERVRGDRLAARAQVGDRRLQGRAHRGVEIVKRERGARRAVAEVAARLDAVGQEHDRVQRTHDRVGQRVFADRRQDALVVDAVSLACQLGPDPRVQHDRVGALERIDRQPARRAFGQQALSGEQPREIVQHPGDARARGVDAVRDGEALREPGHAHDVSVAMRLIELVADPVRAPHEADAVVKRCARGVQCRTSRSTLDPIERPPSLAGAYASCASRATSCASKSASSLATITVTFLTMPPRSRSMRSTVAWSPFPSATSLRFRTGATYGNRLCTGVGSVRYPSRSSVAWSPVTTWVSSEVFGSKTSTRSVSGLRRKTRKLAPSVSASVASSSRAPSEVVVPKVKVCVFPSTSTETRVPAGKSRSTAWIVASSSTIADTLAVASPKITCCPSSRVATDVGAPYARTSAAIGRWRTSSAGGEITGGRRPPSTDRCAG